MQPGRLSRTASGGLVVPVRAYDLLEEAVEAVTPRAARTSLALPKPPPPSKAAVALAALRARTALVLPSRDVARAPAQIFVAMLAASLLACSRSSAAAFHHHGVWAVITVTIALETNVGATWRKASLRAIGTLAGGALGAAAVGATALLCGGWPGGAPAGKVAAMSCVIAAMGAAVQAARARDPGRDYAYGCCTMTLALTALSDFASDDADAVVQSVAWRLITICVGGLFALSTALVVAPEYASTASATTLAAVLRDSSALLRGAVGAHCVAAARPTTHPALHAAELRCARGLDRYGSLCGAAREEAALRVGAALLDNERAAAAGAAARGLFTGAVALLHVLEAAPHSAVAAARCAALDGAEGAGPLGQASAALGDALEAAAALVQERTAERAAAAIAALRAADDAVDELATAASAVAPIAEDEQPATAADEAAAHRCVAALTLTLADAARNAARVVANALPDAEGLPQRWSAQTVLSRGKQRAAALAHEALEAMEAAARNGVAPAGYAAVV